MKDDNYRGKSITLDRAKSLLYYLPSFGIFIRKETRGAHVKGSIAGTLHVGYIRIGVDGEHVLAHRLAWLFIYGEWPAQDLDHIDGDRTNNRPNNLRLANNTSNQRNAQLRNDNKTGIPGVSWHSRDSIWSVKIGIGGKSKALGYFDDQWDAICARKSAEYEYKYHVNHGRSSLSRIKEMGGVGE